MSHKLREPRYTMQARERAKLRGWWGFTCAMLTGVIAIAALTWIILMLADWHDQLHHPERLGIVSPDGRPVELWLVPALATFVPCLAVVGLLLNTVIWLTPPLRALSEQSGRIDPNLGFVPMQAGLAKLALWSIWTIPLAVVTAWLAP